LYATGAPGLGATIEEALAMSANALVGRSDNSRSGKDIAPPYQIPSELLDPTHVPMEAMADHRSDQAASQITYKAANSSDFVRGGDQGDEATYYAHNPEDFWGPNVYDDVRQNEYEQLHHQMYVDQAAVQQRPVEEQM